MTPIQIRTKGQKLILVSSPPLYSGSINKNIIKINKKYKKIIKN